MPKKRIIFTLLYSEGQFLISRNFKIQKIGDINWLNKNYNFKEIANAIDELIILNIGKKDEISFSKFCNILKKITKGIFVPVAAGGGIDSLDRAKKILRSGSDKIVINSLALHNHTNLNKFINVFGSQCVVISLDLIKDNNKYYIWDNLKNGISKIKLNMYLKNLAKYKFGEIYITSIDKDGTGQGYDFKMLNLLGNKIFTPIIMSGGAGNWHHLYEGLLNKNIDAVSTANLLNFVDKGLINSRKNILDNRSDLPIWE